MNLKQQIYIILFLGLFTYIQAQVIVYPKASNYTIELTRKFSKSIFELNGIPYLQPLVESLNGTSNSRFFNSAYVPQKVDKAYFRISVNGMYGFIPSNKKNYSPALPGADLSIDELTKYIDFDFTNPSNPVKSIKDTAGLMFYALQVYAKKGVESGIINIPQSAATVLGGESKYFYIPRAGIDSLVKAYPVIPGINRPLYEMFSDSMKATLIKTINGLPETYTLLPGSGLEFLYAGVPQFEIGSLWGTEALIRVIPPINYGTKIGTFAFWGLGLKHSISQYFPERWFDMAIQGGYQGTYLTNEVGVTKAHLKALANIFNVSLQFSKHIEDVFDIYTGFAYDFINIKSTYDYKMYSETQWELGLLRGTQVGSIVVIHDPEPELGYPGDTVVQHSDLSLNDRNFRWVIGLSRDIGDFSISLDFCISKFNIFTGGLTYRF